MKQAALTELWKYGHILYLIILACLHVHSVRSAIGKSNLSTTSWSNNIQFKHLDVMPNFLVSYN